MMIVMMIFNFDTEQGVKMQQCNTSGEQNNDEKEIKTMGAVIYICGELSLKSKNGNRLTPEQREFICSIKDGWGGFAFKFLPEGYIALKNKEAEGFNPVEDGMDKPIMQLVTYANKNDLLINGDVSSTSDWSDFNTTYEIVDNEIKYHDTQLYNADDSSLIKELEYRGYTVRKE